jgi:two-component system chemotaxis response regulator CheB
VPEVRSGDPVRPAHLYVARPDRHLLVTGGVLLLANGPRENGFRPAVDPLFRTAAAEYGERVIGIVLSGALGDGALGLAHIKSRGGLAIVQHPEDAQFSSMPARALREVAVDYVLPAADIAPRLVALAGRPVEEALMPDQRPHRPDSAEAGRNLLHAAGLSPPSPFTCPDCGGALWEVTREGMISFTCHVGHRYTQEAVSRLHGESVERAMWRAVRVLEENAALNRRLAGQATARHLAGIAAGYERRAEESERGARLIRRAIIGDALEDPEAIAERA